MSKSNSYSLLVKRNMHISELYSRNIRKRIKEQYCFIIQFNLQITKKELENRAKNIDLLRRNLNLLSDEFKEQVTRMRKEVAQQNSMASERSGDFINVFANNKGTQDSDEEGEESDRDLNDEERDILQQFEENDKELENIALELVDALDEVKMKAQNNEDLIKRQNELLKKTRKKAEDNENKLRQNNNQLKQTLAKYKNGKQMCLDMALCLIFIGLLGVLLKMMSSKGLI
ncbi:UNKNOWN [Stylonychia lemnae]|uniref:t-SNARE coiled-coil homology domain-containing protein n=1 Tax=Stylonychia lemnae TaxID=5949 RepID=A0A078ADZ6_STYLE|nr:UNKNOWN [Stylonychia lemnae]|eukprot:CDW80071.1 UNKNOWN [Stylonychia lemnae]